jgi:hypothetical protein
VTVAAVVVATQNFFTNCPLAAVAAQSLSLAHCPVMSAQ